MEATQESLKWSHRDNWGIGLTSWTLVWIPVGTVQARSPNRGSVLTAGCPSRRRTSRPGHRGRPGTRRCCTFLPDSLLTGILSRWWYWSANTWANITIRALQKKKIMAVAPHEQEYCRHVSKIVWKCSTFNHHYLLLGCFNEMTHICVRFQDLDTNMMTQLLTSCCSCKVMISRVLIW